MQVDQNETKVQGLQVEMGDLRGVPPLFHSLMPNPALSMLDKSFTWKLG